MICVMCSKQCGGIPTTTTTTKKFQLQFNSETYDVYVSMLLLLLLVFSPWAGLGRDQSSVRRLVWLWYAASWANSQGQLAIAFPCFLDVSTFHHQVPTHPPQRERSQWRKLELWARMLSGNFAKMTTSTPFRDLLHARKSTTWDRWLYFPSEGRRAEDFFALKNPTASAGFERANLGTKGQHATPRPPKPLCKHVCVCNFQGDI